MAKSAVWPYTIIIHFPFFDNTSGLINRGKPVMVSSLCCVKLCTEGRINLSTREKGEVFTKGR